MKHEGSDVGTAGGLAKSLLREPTAFGHFEAEMQHQFLPRCQLCNAPHPMARKPKLDVDNCPDCGHLLPTRTELVDVPAVVTDWKFSVGNLLMKIGAKLNRLSQRL